MFILASSFKSFGCASASGALNVLAKATFKL